MSGDIELRMEVPSGLASRLTEVWKPAFLRVSDLAAAWLFGSAAHGGMAADLDVGILLTGRPLLGLAEKAALAGQLEDLSPVPLPVDLRALTAEDPLFSFAVLSDGARIYEGNRTARVAFEAAVFSGYQDLAPLVETARLGLMRSLNRGQG